MTREQVIQKVLSKLDEVAPFDDSTIVTGADSLANPVRAIVLELMDECANQVLLDAPINSCPVTSFSSTITLDITNASVDGVLTIQMAADFIKIATLDLSCWDRPISRTYPQDHPIYQLQRNKYTRGGLSKPVGILIKTPAGFNIECYTITKPTSITGFVRTATYIKRTAIELLPDNLIELATWLCAARVCQAIGRDSKIIEEYSQAIAALWSSQN